MTVAGPEGDPKPRRRTRRSPDSKAAFPLSKVQYSETGKPYVEKWVRHVDGTTTKVKRWGKVQECVECGTGYLSINRTNLGYCSRSCAKQGKPNPRLHTKSGLKMRCDKLFSLHIRSRGSCQRCGTSDYRKLQCAHVVSRRYLATRWDADNAFCLCAGCHYWGHAHPLEWDDFVVSMMGQEAYDDIKQRARREVHPDYMVILGRMEALVNDERDPTIIARERLLRADLEQQGTST